MEFILYKIGCFLGIHLPPFLAYPIGRTIGRIRYCCSPKLRAALKSNLKVVLTYKAAVEGVLYDPQTLRKTTRLVYRNFAIYLTEFFRIPLWDRKTVMKNVELVGIEHLEKAFSAGRGVVVLTGHIGNWELAGVVTSLLGYPMNAVALPFKNRKIARVFIERRESKGVHVILTGAGPKEILRVFKNNEMVAVLGDRLFTEKGIEAMFMGRKTLLPRGPATLAVKTGARYLPGFLVRKNGKYQLIFEQLLEAPEHLSESERVQILVDKGAKVLEKYILMYPDQWLNFTPLWPT